MVGGGRLHLHRDEGREHEQPCAQLAQAVSAACRQLHHPNLCETLGAEPTGGHRQQSGHYEAPRTVENTALLRCASELGPTLRLCNTNNTAGGRYFN